MKIYSFIFMLCLVPFLAEACQICLPMPKESAADRLLSSEVVAFARENPDKPFSLKITEVLKGDPASQEIDLFLDSRSRRLLAMDPSRKILCVYTKEKGWVRSGLSDAEGIYEKLVRDILKQAETWKRSPDARPLFFSRFLGHDDPQLRQLAHLEVARAPYSAIKELGDVVPIKKIRAFLDDNRYLEWHALYILLLAQSVDEKDHERIRRQARSEMVFGLNDRFSAWATAWIEIDRSEAIQFYKQRYLANPDRDPELVHAVVSAMSVHGDGVMRNQISDAFAMLLKTHPVLTPVIAQDLIRWQ